MTPDARTVEERAGVVPGTLSHPEWLERWPWLVQGITLDEPGAGGDMAWFGGSPAGDVTRRWEGLLARLPVEGAVYARQVHGSGIRFHSRSPAGLHLTRPADGHVTLLPALLLTVSVADCVPVYLVDPSRRAVGVVHAGWRGVAAGILEVSVGTFQDRLGARPRELHLHLGPSICGSCYEVGPEVHRALGEPEPARATPVDLTRNLARRAIARGLPAEHLTRSAHCTLCGDAPLFSHRGGDGGRQMGFVAVAP